MRCTSCGAAITQEILDSQPYEIKYTFTNMLPTLCMDCYKKHMDLINFIHGKGDKENESDK